MNNIFEFLKSMNEITERTKSLSVLTSPLHMQTLEMVKLSNTNFHVNEMSMMLPISKLITTNSFKNSLLNSNRINDSMNIAMMPIARIFQNYDFQKLNQSFKIPDSTLVAFSNLAKQQEHINKKLLNSLTAINSFSNATFEINKIQNLNIAFSSLSSQIVKIASLNQNWQIIDDFQNLTTEVISLSEQLTEDLDELNPDNFTIEFKNFLKSVEDFYQKHKEAGIIMFFIIDIILRFAGLHQYYDFIKDKPETSTKIEISELKNTHVTILKSIEEINNQIKQKDKFSFTNKKCEIKLKPNSRSIIINVLPEKHEIIIVKIQPTWILINFSDPKDNLPQTGWVNKNDIQ